MTRVEGHAVRINAAGHSRPNAKARFIDRDDFVGSRSARVNRVTLRYRQNAVNGADVCIRTGPGGRTVLYGEGQSVRIAWLRPGSESRLSFLGTIAHRVGLAKLNPLGSWLLLFLGLVLAAAWFVALRTVLREVGP